MKLAKWAHVCGDGSRCGSGELRPRTPAELEKICAEERDPMLDFGCCRHRASAVDACRCGCRHEKWRRVP